MRLLALAFGLAACDRTVILITSDAGQDARSVPDAPVHNDAGPDANFLHDAHVLDSLLDSALHD
jgi:hypothetical protein